MNDANSFVREYGHVIFNFGVGLYLIEIQNIPLWIILLLSCFAVFFGIITIMQFASYTAFWNTALKHADHFGPGGELHDHGVSMLNRTSNAVVGYRHKETFWISVASSLVFMAGLIEQQLWFVFTIEAIASIIGYAFIRSFLTHFNVYLTLVEGNSNG